MIDDHPIFFHHKRHPSQIGEAEIEAYVTYLAQECHVVGSTQIQALSALLFLYREVVGQTPSAPIKPARTSKTNRQDLAQGHGAVMLPYALARKYPQANREWIWQFVFPSAILSVDQQDGVIRRFHNKGRAEYR